MRRYRFELTGTMPLLMHSDNVESADSLTEWRKAPENKNKTVKGDDRSPPWTWQTYCYDDGTYLAIPSDNLLVCLREAGKELIVNGRTTFKSLTQSGLRPVTMFLPLNPLVPLSSLPSADLDFKTQSNAVRDLGFRLFIKRARVGSAKHVRVRPRFDKWSIVGEIDVITDDISEYNLRRLFEIAGEYKGLGDWRPSSKTPGPFGCFKAVVSEV